MKKTLFLLVIFIAASGLWGQQKYALVIGNGNYTHVGKLNNPVNDANDVAAALQGMGFTVEKVLNGSLDQMEGAAIRLKNRLSAAKNSYGFLFYAGHGVQSGGENYLIPVDANIQSESFLRQRAVSVQAMLDELNDAGNQLNVVVLDACRDNPFSWKRSGSRGLSVVGQQPADSIIVFATSAGSTASDGTGRNGLFTTHLLNNLKTSGLEVKEVFNRTGADVSRASNRQQIPAVYNQFFENAYLGARPAVNTPVQPAPAVQPAPTPAPVVQPATTHAQPPTPAVQPTVLPSTHPVRPEQQVSLTPQPFSPDGDGVDDELIININVKNNHPIRNWSIEIREPESPYLLFYEWKGEGNPPSTLIWNGKKTSGELVQSATKYSFVLTVTDTQNKISKFNESVEVDVMVHREGNLLRVIVPSIIFASNTGDFKKLTEEQMKHNDRILWRIAEVLGRFDTYKVTVEGHANPTTAPGTRARTTEETGTNREIGLRSLSQQRAQTVVNYLADLGIDRSRLTPMGVGSSRTVVEFTDKDNWWKNRRVEFVLVK